MTDGQMNQPPKNPVIATLLSMFPGLGLVYTGNIMKALAYMSVTGCLIVLLVNCDGTDVIAFSLLLGGFYIFQIFDSFEDARKSRTRHARTDNGLSLNSTLFSGLLLLGIGIIFQLASLNIIRYRDITSFWPLVLVALGAKFIHGYFQNEKNLDAGGKNE